MRKKFANPLLNQSGTSLIEIMMTVFIFSIVAGGIYSIILVSDASWETNDRSIEMQQEHRKAVEWMKDELRQAGTASIFNIPADGNWHNDNISFKKAEGVSGGNVNWGANAIQFLRGGTNNQQLLRIQGGNTKVLANNILVVRFKRLASNPELLEVRMEADGQTSDGQWVGFDNNFNVQLRN